MDIYSETAGPICPTDVEHLAAAHRPASNDCISSSSLKGDTFPCAVEGLLCGRIMNIMVDTGSSVSLLKRSLFAMLLEDGRVINHRVVNNVVRNAFGEESCLTGLAMVTIRIGERETVHPFLLADTLVAPVILGRDFVTENQWCIDLAGNCLRRAPGETVPLLMKEEVNDKYETTKLSQRYFASSTIIDDEDELLDDCAVPNYNAKNIFDLPQCTADYAAIVQEFKELFSVKPGSTHVAYHVIPTADDAPIRVPLRRLPAHFRDELPIHPDDRQKTEFARDQFFPALNGQCYVGYLSQWAIQMCCCSLSEDEKSHRQHLKQVLRRCKAAGLTLRGSKCQIGLPEVGYPGHIFSSEGMSVDPLKTAVVANWPQPANVTDDFATIAKSLHELTQGKATSEWNEQCEDAFKLLKKTLTTAPTLAAPVFHEEFQLHTGASDVGLGALLEQNGQVICYASRLLSKAEKNYSTIEKECLALLFAVK
uniref:Peptidase A2 domain-containing protein n=1 Tax=Trichuris muris TaxID=70415 RepID=A0A5S6QPE7_TRIMR